MYELIIAAVGGGFLIKAIELLVDGWKQARRAKGLVTTKTDAALQARLEWRDEAYEQRRSGTEQGAEMPELPTEDAFTRWQEKQTS